MLQYNGNTEVLDLGLFDVDESEIEKREEAVQRQARRLQPKKKVNSTPCKQGNWLVFVILATLALAPIFMFFYGSIELTSLNSETVAVMSRLDEAQRENGRLNTELNSMITPSRVSEFAAEHGLVREQLAQVKHIRIELERVVEVAEPRELGFFDTIENTFNEILEFLSLN